MAVTFYQSDLYRIITDLTQEYEADQPDWQRVLRKVDDLTALALAAFKYLLFRRER